MNRSATWQSNTFCRRTCERVPLGHLDTASEHDAVAGKKNLGVCEGRTLCWWSKAALSLRQSCITLMYAGDSSRSRRPRSNAALPIVSTSTKYVRTVVATGAQPPLPKQNQCVVRTQLRCSARPGGVRTLQQGDGAVAA